MTFLAEMAEWLAAVIGIVAVGVGAGVGFMVARQQAARRHRQTQSQAEEILAKARTGLATARSSAQAAGK